MYSQKQIEATLEAFAAREGWRPVPHSLIEVKEFEAYVESITTIERDSKNSYVNIKDGVALTAKRQRELYRWFENEQAMCSIDSGYFESHYAYIADETGAINKFENRKSQEILDSIIADLEDRGFGIEMLILGSRQSGVGTKILLKILHRTLFIPNTSAALGSVVHEKSDYMKQFINVAYDNLPWWLPPLRIKNGLFANNSKLGFYSGISASGIAQGYTPNCIYLSEVNKYPTPAKTIEDGLLRAVHSSRNLFLVLHGMKEESDWLRDLYRYAKEYWSQGKFRFCPVFIPWPMSTDVYPNPDWIRRYPIPEHWMPIKETLEHKRRCEKFVRSTAYLAKIVGEDWEMPQAQQWYWEFNYREAKVRKTLDQFERNFCADDGEVAAIESEQLAEVDIETLFPSPTDTQERVAAIR